MAAQLHTLAGSLPLSALVAALPILALLLLLGVMRKPAWMASLIGLGSSNAGGRTGLWDARRPPAGAVTNGAAFGLFPIGWVVFSAILLYRVTVESGKFEILKNSVGDLTGDPRLQALLIAFAFGAFVEGAAGFGTPVAVAGAMLAGLGVAPFRAAAICLLANTAPVAFGSIAIPITTLAATTGLPFDRLSAGVGRICAPVSLVIPAYLILVMFGWSGLRAVFPAAAVCGVVFAGTQFTVSNFLNAQLTDILSSMAAMAALVAMIKIRGSAAPAGARRRRPAARGVFIAWAPYLLLVIFVLLWGYAARYRSGSTISRCLIHWPGMPAKPLPLNSAGLSASGTACLLAALLGAVVVRLSPRQFLRRLGPYAQATGPGRTDARGGAGAGVPDELLRRDHYPGTGLRGHRRGLSVRQRAVRLAGSVPHRQRHFLQRAVRQSAGGDGTQIGNERGSDGGVQFRRRSDGQNDQPHQHRGGRLRHQHEARGRVAAVPLHVEA